MGTFSIWHLLILGAIILILFGGRGRISDIMGDVARGIRSFRKGLAEDEKPIESQKEAAEKDRVKN